MDKSICTLLLLMPLLSIHTRRVHGEGFVMMPIELAPIPCNDKAVEKLSRLAVTYINEDRTEGYKFALNRIANVFLHAQGPAGNVYYLDLDVLETKCHTGSPKPWKRCDVRPFMETQISGNCNTTILHTPEGYSYLYSYDCALVPDPPEKLQQTCPTCPQLLSVDSPEAMIAARVTLASYKRKSTLAAGLGVKKITRAAAQVLPVKASFVEYTVQECPEGVTERGTCQRLTIASDTETAGFCTGSVHGDVNDHPDVQAACEMFKVQNVDVLRPVQPQGHDFPLGPMIPTFPPIPDDPQPVPTDPPMPTAVQPAPFDPAPVPFDPAPVPPVPFDPAPVPPVPFDPAPVPPVPFDPAPVPPVPFDPAPVQPVPFDPSVPGTSSSSESAEDLVSRQQQPSGTGPFASSSEEIGGPVALRPPLNFRYQKRDRKKRQALMETSPSHEPVFLSDFPSGSSPFRSCPGPARYTTV